MIEKEPGKEGRRQEERKKYGIEKKKGLKERWRKDKTKENNTRQCQEIHLASLNNTMSLHQMPILK